SGHRLIDLSRPLHDSAAEVAGLREALLAEEGDRLGAAHTALAVDDDLALWIEFADALRQLGQRQQRAAGKAANLVLRRVAHIEDEDILAAVEALLQLLNGQIATRRRRGWRFDPAHAAELVVVDQFLDRRAVAADGAFGVAPYFERLKGHGQRVVMQQAAEQRFALADDQLHRFRRLNHAD